MPYKNLTKEQIEAVEFTGNLLLTACPGSGKTKALVSKLFYLIDNKIHLGFGKRLVIAITYTNIAADTIIQRLGEFGISSNSLWVGTIHSFCLKWIIKPNQNKIKRLCKGYVIVDEYEKEVIVDEIKNKFNYKGKNAIVTGLNANYEPIYELGTIEYKIVTEYHSYLRGIKSIDFDLILNISNKLLRENEEIAIRLGGLIYHMLIDEYQDTNNIQYEIVRMISSSKKTTLTFIGDVEQAIYTGLGAEVKNKAELQSFFGFPSLTELKLTGCFRSSQRIVDFYTKYQDSGYNINSLSKLKSFPSVTHLERDIELNKLAIYVSDIVHNHMQQGISENEIVILCSSWYDVQRLSKEIDILDTNFKINGFLISPIPKNQDNIWLDLIKLYLTPPSPESYTLRGHISLRLSENLQDIYGVTPTLLPKKILKSINSISIQEEDICSWIENLINSFCRQSSIELLNSLGEKNKSSLITSTEERIKKYSFAYTSSDLPRFFSNPAGVKITTNHSTKGDEYDVVICTGLLKGKVPHWGDIIGCSDAHQNYTARRLLYVIASRARKHLYFISEKGHKTQKGNNYAPTEQI